MTMTWLGGSTLGSSGSFDFQNIPATFAHLEVRFSGRGTFNAANDSILIRFNNDSATNYVIHRLYGDGSSVGSQAFLTQTYVICGDMPAATASSSSTVGVSITSILDYANTNKNKVARVLAGRDENGSGYAWFNSGLWLNTAAINRVTVLAANGSFTAGSRADLYGIGVSDQTGA